MQRAMAKQAEAEREKRAKLILADAEFLASEKLWEAAKMISRDPAALQLRYLQTLTQISEEKTTIILYDTSNLNLALTRLINGNLGNMNLPQTLVDLANPPSAPAPNLAPPPPQSAINAANRASAVTRQIGDAT